MRHAIKSRQMVRLLVDEQGVTLLELVVYLVVSGMLLGVAVTAFMGQNSSYNRQDVIAEIQQNIRGATEQMSSDIRFAGIGLHETEFKAFAIAQSDNFGINLDSDLGEDWDPFNDQEKIVRYRLNGTNLQRGYTTITTPANVSNWEIVAENIERLRFEYLVEDSGSWDWKNQLTTGSTDLGRIRAVKIVMLGSARDSAFNPTDSTIYEPPLEASSETWTPAAGTGYKRMMSTIVQCRNNRG